MGRDECVKTDTEWVVLLQLGRGTPAKWMVYLTDIVYCRMCRVIPTVWTCADDHIWAHANGFFGKHALQAKENKQLTDVILSSRMLFEGLCSRAGR
jgi:hypothetical protein